MFVRLIKHIMLKKRQNQVKFEKQILNYINAFWVFPSEISLQLKICGKILTEKIAVKVKLIQVLQSICDFSSS